MKPRTVISWKCLPNRSPVVVILLMFMALDFYKCPAWAWGAAGLLALLLIVDWLVSLFTYRHKNIPGFGDE